VVQLDGLGDLGAYNPRSCYEETMRGRGGDDRVAHHMISGGQKVISGGGEHDDDDSDLGDVHAGPPMGRQLCSQGQQGPCVHAGRVTQEPRIWGASKGSGRYGVLASKKSQEGATALLYRGEEGGKFREGVTHIGEEEEGVA
jgi:hypothetical protein